MRRSTLEIGALVAVAVGTAAAGYLVAADQCTTDAALEHELANSPRDRDADHRPANVTVGAHDAPAGGSGECVITARIGALNDDDRVSIEPVSTGDTLNPLGYGHVATSMRTDLGDAVRVYSFPLEGDVTMHFDGTVIDDCLLPTATGHTRGNDE